MNLKKSKDYLNRLIYVIQIFFLVIVLVVLFVFDFEYFASVKSFLFFLDVVPSAIVIGFIVHAFSQLRKKDKLLINSKFYSTSRFSNFIFYLCGYTKFDAINRPYNETIRLLMNKKLEIIDSSIYDDGTVKFDFIAETGEDKNTVNLVISDTYFLDYEGLIKNDFSYVYIKRKEPCLYGRRIKSSNFKEIFSDALESIEIKSANVIKLYTTTNIENTKTICSKINHKMYDGKNIEIYEYIDNEFILKRTIKI